MNQLEKEIYDSLLGRENVTEGQNPFTASVCKSHSKVAAGIALKWIEKAMNNLIERNTGSGKLGSLLRKQYESDAKLWLEQNGLKTPEV